MRLSLLLFVSAMAVAAADQPVNQPIAYSHKTHIRLGLKCAECHTMPGKGTAATFPAESKCMGCHTAVKKDSPEILKLAHFYAEKKPVPWVRVYQLPDYVWFSHKRHLAKPGIGCDTCHGPVAERDIIVKEKPITMQACMTCHEQRDASNECNFCHNP